MKILLKTIRLFSVLFFHYFFTSSNKNTTFNLIYQFNFAFNCVCECFAQIRYICTSSMPQEASQGDRLSDVEIKSLNEGAECQNVKLTGCANLSGVSFPQVFTPLSLHCCTKSFEHQVYASCQKVLSSIFAQAVSPFQSSRKWKLNLTITLKKKRKNVKIAVLGSFRRLLSN